MRFIAMRLAGLWLVEPEPLRDERGFFARTWCEREFREHGLDSRLVQCNISFNQKRGTLRGMHYQVAPYEETKLVSCTQGSIYDVAVDLRPGSVTFRQWVGIVLSVENRRMLYIPAGFAHGFITLEDQSTVFYQMSEFYHAEAARGVRWNDPALGIEWPIPVAVISDKDRSYPDLAI